MSSTNLILVILMIQFVAFIGALGFGRLAGRMGAKTYHPAQPGDLECGGDLRLRGR